MCTAQAWLANFIFVVSSTTLNTVQSRRPASQASAGLNPLFLGDFFSVLCIFLSSSIQVSQEKTTKIPLIFFFK